MMGKIVYFTGGARSGKSTQAERYIFMRNYEHKIYIATAIAFDDEMKARVQKHKEQRGENWITIEGYKNLVEQIKPHVKAGGVILLDCLTNMVTNLMIMEKDYDWDHVSNEEVEKLEQTITKEVITLLEYLKSIDMDTVVVSNELGMGLVPAYALGRHFRDICGRMNQLVAGYSREAYFVVSGMMMKLK